MRMRYLLSLALVAVSMTYSPGNSSAKDELSPKLFDGSGGIPCAGVPPRCTNGLVREERNAYLANSSSRSGRSGSFQTRVV
jgi:hypothetical protein